jgi:ubiquinone/menaquinone biosynthesis C-methylase UbiE
LHHNLHEVISVPESENETYDAAILISDTCETTNLVNLVEVAKNISRLLKPEGRFVAALPLKSPDIIRQSIFKMLQEQYRIPPEQLATLSSEGQMTVTSLQEVLRKSELIVPKPETHSIYKTFQNDNTLKEWLTNFVTPFFVCIEESKHPQAIDNLVACLKETTCYNNNQWKITSTFLSVQAEKWVDIEVDLGNADGSLCPNVISGKLELGVTCDYSDGKGLDIDPISPAAKSQQKLKEL